LQLPSRAVSYETLFARVQERRLVAVSLRNHVCFPEIFVAAGNAPNCIAVLDSDLPSAQLEDILPRLMPDLVVIDRPGSPVFRFASKCGLKAVRLGRLSDGYLTIWAVPDRFHIRQYGAAQGFYPQ